jgi:hypothetical protein
MRENEPVLLVLSVCDGKIILEKGEILYEKCHRFVAIYVKHSFGRYAIVVLEDVEHSCVSRTECYG